VNTPLDIILVGDATSLNSTTVVVTSSLNPSPFGQSVTFTATVTTGAGTGALDGTITFSVDGTPEGPFKSPPRAPLPLPNTPLPR